MKKFLENLNLGLNVFTGSIATLAIIILGLSLFWNTSNAYRFWQGLKAKTFSVKGYIYYRPLTENNRSGAENIPNDRYAWFLISNKPDDSIESLEKNDYLYYALDGTYYLRNIPDRLPQKSRAVFFLKENQCVQIIENVQSNIKDNKYENNEYKDNQGKNSIDLPPYYKRIRPPTYYYFDPIKKESVSNYDDDKPFNNKNDMEKAKKDRENEIKQETGKEIKIKDFGMTSKGIWLKVAVAPCPSIEP